MASTMPNLEGLDQSDGVIAVIGRLLDKIDDKDKKIAELQDVIDELRNQEGQQKMTVEDMKIQLAESQKQVDQLKSAQQELRNAVESMKATIHSTTLQTLVDELRKNGSWSAFKHGLAKALDKNSEPYQQLQNISKDHGEPLRTICTGGHQELLALLLDTGLPVDTVISDGGGDTMLHAAAAGGDPHIVRLLLDRGANVMAKNSEEKVPLSVAAANGHMTAIKLLLAHGTGVDTRDVDGRTALHWAAMRGFCDLVKILVDAGADPNIKDLAELTPLDLANSSGRKAVVQFLSPRMC